MPPPSPLPSLHGQRVLVQGLGRFGGGLGVTRFLVEQGAIVTVTDTDSPEKLADSVAQLADLAPRITFKLGAHDLADFTSTDLLVVNPAVDKPASPHVQAALAAAIPLTTELNLFLERCPAFTIGISGSVGKSTTTMLIYQALAAGLHPPVVPSPPPSDPSPPAVFLGGNIGHSLLASLPAMKPADLVVLELSSFMLEDTPRIAWSPNIAVLTNLFPNHLDRHHTMAQYAAEKQNLLKFQKTTDLAIFNNDHELVSRWTHLAKGRVAKYTIRGPKSSHLHLLMPGEHNQSNAQAALAVLDHLPENIRPAFNRTAALHAIETYGGLPHRLQIVHALQLGPGPQKRTVRFYNDSKATSPDASITALYAFPPGTAIFLAGGYDKHIDLSAYEKALAENAAGILGLGATGQAILNTLKNPTHTNGRIAYVNTLDAALPLALQWAARDEKISAIVLSPASASWDQYPNYEIRGDHFAALAKKLSESPAP